jgi:N4-gp56 family major capsid protein
MYGGAATADAQITGEGDDVSVLSWEMLEKLDAQLTKNRSDRTIKMLTGSMNTDTRTVASGRVMYVGPELVPAIKRIKDWNGERAFIPIEQYGSQRKPMNGEFGTVGNWHFIEVPEMIMWEDAGATAGATNKGYRVGPEGKYNVYPCLTIGSDSFNTIDFGAQRSHGAKCKLITKMPGRETASALDPYGMEGFTSAQWYYGFFCRRPEWIGLCKVVAPL